jgi:phospholipid/cholesterol/gamma-HCH transport system substrate-binding protein
MRRIAATTVLLAIVGALLALVFGSSAQGSSSQTFDVIFDDARGLIGGQLVKVAGAKAGTIENVTVTHDFKARIEASIDGQFMPFHTNATCTIRPEGLIAENYIDCNPGSPPAPVLKSTNGQPPTVPVQNTTEPVSLLDLFNIFNLPTRERFGVIINELGIGTAGRGADFNDVLRRANPALALARKAISILTRQRSQLATLVDATNSLAKDGAAHTQLIQNFLDRASALTAETADHASPLAQSINRLPALLDAARPALQQLDTVAVDGTPLVQQIHAAVPALNRVTNDLGPFVTAAQPGLDKLGAALEKAIPAIRETTPLVRTLRSYADRSKGNTTLFARLSQNLQQHGFVENFLSITYYIGASLARFDSTSHLLGVLLLGPQNGACGAYATTPVAGCSAHYGTAAKYTPSKAGKASTKTAVTRVAHHAARPDAKPAASGTTSTQPSNTAPAGGAGGAGAAIQDVPQSLISQVLAGASSAAGQTTQNLQSLVNYLLK